MTGRTFDSALDPDIAARLKRDEQGLFPAVAQQHDTGEVLMVGWMDDEALHRTLTSGRCTYWSRSRQEYWVKGETSGHQQWVKSVSLDCDSDRCWSGSIRSARRATPATHVLRQGTCSDSSSVSGRRDRGNRPVRRPDPRRSVRPDPRRAAWMGPE